jgi:hypothetical protein
MVWIKIKNTLINLNNVTFVEKRNNKIIISPILEIITKNEEIADAIFNLINKAIAFSKNKIFADIDKYLKEEYNININEAIDF